MSTIDDRPGFGWRSDGSVDPNGDPASARSVAMRNLIAARREVDIGRRLTPRDIAAMVLGGFDRAFLESMFPERTLERWVQCHEWRAWELLEWTARIGGAQNTAAFLTIRCGYLEGEWWGGRVYPRAQVERWVAAKFQRPRSAWDEPQLVARFGPLEDARGEAARVQKIDDQVERAEPPPPVLELDFQSPATDSPAASTAGGSMEAATPAGASEPSQGEAT